MNYKTSQLTRQFTIQTKFRQIPKLIISISNLNTEYQTPTMTTDKFIQLANDTIRFIARFFKVFYGYNKYDNKHLELSVSPSTLWSEMCQFSGKVGMLTKVLPRLSHALRPHRWPPTGWLKTEH